MSTTVANELILDDADPFETTESGDVRAVSGEKLAQERILRLLFTEPGDIVHRPELGAGLQSYRGKSPTPFNIRRLRNDTQRLLDALPFVDDYLVDVRTTTVDGAAFFELLVKAVVDGVELTLPEVVIA